MLEFETVRNSVSLSEYCVLRGMKKRGQDTFVCPICGSGEGPHKTAAFHVKGFRWKCFSCNNSGDVFDLTGYLDGTTDKVAQLRTVTKYASACNVPSTTHVVKMQDYAVGRSKEVAYLQAMKNNIREPEAVEYVISRGFTVEEVEAWGVGFDPSRHRLILPWIGSDYYHIDRSTDGSQPKYVKPKAAEIGPQPLYNAEAVKASAFFVVEGVLDALAILACGYQAVALGGTGCRSTVRAIRESKPTGVALAMLDNDEAGRNANGELVKELAANGITYSCVDIGKASGMKDAAEWLSIDREGLTSFLREQYAAAERMAITSAGTANSGTLGRLRVVDPWDIAKLLMEDSQTVSPIPTGFETLDSVLAGGLQAGLYVIGSVSSLGKTTFCSQMADQIAASETPVLFVTIEQSAREIVAKSLSRIMSKHGRGYSTVDVTNRMRRAQWAEADYSRLKDAHDEFGRCIAPNLSILEGIRQPSVSEIGKAAREMARNYGRPPVVFVDYLQLLAPQRDYDSDKQAIDRNVMALRQMARDLESPVVAVSSLNRSSYNEGVTMEAFKESGGIEYGADVLLGLQPEGMRERIEQASATRARKTAARCIRESKEADVRVCEIVILKNRVGRIPDRGIPFTFWPSESTFTEGIDQKLAQHRERRRF